MAKKILVPTDLSANSKAGIRFAFQLQKQGNYGLVFYHCVPYLKPTRWSDARYKAHLVIQKEEAVKRLKALVGRISKTAEVTKPDIELIVRQSTNVNRAIINYAAEIDAEAICMSTRGAGKLKKLVGTNTSGVIRRAPVPVFVVPGNYRSTGIKHILYSSDLNEIGPELKQVRKVARKLNATIAVYHYDYMADVKEVRKKFDRVARRYRRPGVTFRFRKYDMSKSLASHLREDMSKAKASLTVLFTDKKRGWFDRLFLGSKSVDLVFNPKAPLLIFPKPVTRKEP